MRAGFTLIELLVVIGIIAVLAAIVIPVYARAQERARQATCISNLHSIVVALKIYHQDYRDYPPPYDWEYGTGGISALYPDYITDTKSLRCPNDRLRDFADYSLLYLGLVDPADQAAFDTRWTASGFFREHYSSYNQDTSPALGNSGNPDTDADGVADVSFVLYNYYGYGRDPATYPTDTKPGHEKLAMRETPQRDEPLPSLNYRGVKYPRLMNRFAPDETIVTHCPYHRDFFRGYDAAPAQDVVARLGGSVALEQVNTRPEQEYWIDQRPQ